MLSPFQKLNSPGFYRDKPIVLEKATGHGRCRDLRPAFTLIELLVVIALLALLMAILFPVFARSREKARSTACVSNLRQIGTSMALYTQDYDGLYPYGADPIDKLSDAWQVSPNSDPLLRDMPLLHEIMRPYVKNADLWRCPSDVGFDEIPDLSGIDQETLKLKGRPTAFEAFGTSYAYRTELAFRHLLYGAPGYSNGDEVGAAGILVVIDLTGVWHGGKTGSEWRFDGVFADGHAVSLDAKSYEEAWGVSLTKKP